MATAGTEPSTLPARFGPGLLEGLPEGRPLWVKIPRWTDANPGRKYRMQPCGGTLANVRETDGDRLPFRVDAGNVSGTDVHFPFYRVQVEEIRMRHGTDHSGQ